MQETIKKIFTENIQVQIAAGEVLPSALESAAFTIAQSLINGNKLLCCGTANCHMLAQHMAGLLINFYETERPCLPAVALAQEQVNLGQSNHNDEHEAFARQIRAFAQEGDLLLAIAVNGNEKQIISAVEAALTRDMKVIVLVGDDGGELVGLLGPNDVEIRVPSKRPSRIVESHLVNLHCLGELIDLTLFPQEENNV
ncbi:MULTISPECIES: SIS domain-containing protein [unclassified Pseudoalteromonas]|jgi:DnaA initiator-associating protein|uniref:SIS domain-containing protein n=1 Tax=unclassified Pseudoalteromonas TaxID=194690 RepID=UPI001022D2D8|nr:SIS domain-containing protein [Pseudoalteromonas sp. L1]RZF94543.1 SIS domain-containing protein [Pseudoalteromonas sp. CO302Y]RZG11170.1 SIS domain-containing protein [Pseudoalteromonas sp. CO133X]WOC25805.1 SIS domain-containing protein [Pseudoalteromonas sp. N1230-9]